MTGWVKLNKLLLWSTLFVLPLQLRHTFLFAEHQGQFFEYASLSLYLSDILIVLTLLTSFLGGKHKFTIGPKIMFWPFAGLIIWMWVSVWLSKFSTGNWAVSLNATAHFSLLFLFYLYLINHIRYISEVVAPLIWGSGLQAVTAIGQYVTNHSLGLKYLGESVLDPSLAGVPVVMINGARHLRAHGTLPHANILGGYLAWILLWTGTYYGLIKQNWERWLLAIGLVLGGTALLFSFSRTAWLVFGLVGIVLLVGRFYKGRKIGWLDGIIILIMLSVIINQWPAIKSRFNIMGTSLEQESVVSRLDQINQFKSIYQKYPLTGVGLGQYTLYLEQQDTKGMGWNYSAKLSGWTYNLSRSVWDYQPIHNLFLLILAELGWVGLGLFILLLLGSLWIGLRQLKITKDLVSLTALGTGVGVIGLGLLDHYLWTLQPGRFVLFLSISIIAVLYQSRINNPIIYE